MYWYCVFLMFHFLHINVRLIFYSTVKEVFFVAFVLFRGLPTSPNSVVDPDPYWIRIQELLKIYNITLDSDPNWSKILDPDPK